MIFLYIQHITLGAKIKVPYRLVLFSEDFSSGFKVFPIRPERTIPKKSYEQNHLDRMEVLASEPFCNSADELIDLFTDQKLVFSEKEQFILLKAQFRTIGYNFNLKPIILWTSGKKENTYLEQLKELISERYEPTSLTFAETFLETMANYKIQQKEKLEDYKSAVVNNHTHDLSRFNQTPGVYFFLNETGEVIYVGKAKNIRKRLQSHFSNTAKTPTIKYSEVADIDVVSTGNDIIAQLIESENIKNLKPVYNSQQVEDPDPFIITLSATAKGISKIKITRKEFEDSLPEKYFNRRSVVESLNGFCNEYDLCRKHCALETVKGPCSKVTKKEIPCVCSGEEAVEAYNKRFQVAFEEFRRKRTAKIFKLKGRNLSEDAFIYELNGIYEGYGYIDKSLNISNYNDILGYLIRQKNNYDTSRILNALHKIISAKDVLELQ